MCRSMIHSYILGYFWECSQCEDTYLLPCSAIHKCSQDVGPKSFETFRLSGPVLLRNACNLRRSPSEVRTERYLGTTGGVFRGPAAHFCVQHFVHRAHEFAISISDTRIPLLLSASAGPRYCRRAPLLRNQKLSDVQRRRPDRPKWRSLGRAITVDVHVA